MTYLYTYFNFTVGTTTSIVTKSVQGGRPVIEVRSGIIYNNTIYTIETCIVFNCKQKTY